MMRRTLLSCILAAMLAALPLQTAVSASSGMAFLSNYVQTLYDEDSAIPVSQVKSVLQTSDGYLWFGGYQGLIRYDGMSSQLFTAQEGFPSYNVNVLFEDSRQRLWAGTNDKGVVLYDGNDFTVYGIAEGLPAASVRGITEDEYGNLFVSTTNGIATISPDGSLLPHPTLGRVFATHVGYLGGGRCISLLSDGKVILFDQNGALRFYESSHFGEETPISLFVAGDGQIYLGTAGSLVYRTDRNLARVHTLTIPERRTLNAFYEDSAGRIWVCADDGLGYLRGESFTPVNGLLMSNSIECIYEDYEGSFWVGSSRQGLLQLTQGKFQNVSFLAGLPDYTVNTTALWNGDLYIGADEGLLILRDYVPLQNELTALLRGVRVRSLLADSQGRLWICTYENYGVLMLRPDGSLLSIGTKQGLASDKTRCILEAQNGDILVGMSGGVSVIRNERVVRSYTKSDGLHNDVILSLCEDRHGVLYAGSDGGGIYAIEGPAVTAYTERDGLAAGIILRMTATQEGVWISTGNAICLMDKGEIRILEQIAAYDDNVFDIKQIGEELWFLHTKGISIFDTQSLLLDEPQTPRQLLRRDGLSSPVTANSWNALSEDGILYLSTGKGVLSVDTQMTPSGRPAPRAAVVQLLADGQRLPTQGQTVLSSKTQRLDIHVALLSFASRDGTVSYMLEGFDSEPVTAPRDGLAWISYTNLKGGKYTFQIYGKNAEGLQSETVTLPISKEYAPLEMPFVHFLLVFFGGGALFLGVRASISLRTRAAVLKQKDYQKITGQIMALAADMADARNPATFGHSRRVAEYARMVGRRLGMTESEQESLFCAAILHDVGKAGIPDEILEKSGPLSPQEYEIAKRHVTLGVELLDKVMVIDGVTLGARYHHERMDGRGYPAGLTAEEIPLAGRIIGVCNALDSMLSDRPYRPALSLEAAQSELIHNAGTQFDEKVTAVLISLIHEGGIPL